MSHPRPHRVPHPPDGASEESGPGPEARQRAAEEAAELLATTLERTQP